MPSQKPRRSGTPQLSRPRPRQALPDGPPVRLEIGPADDYFSAHTGLPIGAPSIYTRHSGARYGAEWTGYEVEVFSTPLPDDPTPLPPGPVGFAQLANDTTVRFRVWLMRVRYVGDGPLAEARWRPEEGRTEPMIRNPLPNTPRDQQERAWRALKLIDQARAQLGRGDRGRPLGKTYESRDEFLRDARQAVREIEQQPHRGGRAATQEEVAPRCRGLSLSGFRNLREWFGLDWERDIKRPIEQ